MNTCLKSCMQSVVHIILFRYSSGPFHRQQILIHDRCHKYQLASIGILSLYCQNLTLFSLSHLRCNPLLLGAEEKACKLPIIVLMSNSENLCQSVWNNLSSGLTSRVAFISGVSMSAYIQMYNSGQ